MLLTTELAVWRTPLFIWEFYSSSHPSPAKQEWATNTSEAATAAVHACVQNACMPHLHVSPFSPITVSVSFVSD